MFAPPLSLSQLAASFVDFLCQGIRRAPLTSSPIGPLGSEGARGSKMVLLSRVCIDHDAIKKKLSKSSM